MARGMFIVDGIGPVLDFMAATTATRVTEAVREGALELEAYARMNAPWADRTGEARSGLSTEVSNEMGEIVIDLFHTAEHGQWLEVIQDGRFAIIMPTLEALAPEIFAKAGAMVISTSPGSGGWL